MTRQTTTLLLAACIIASAGLAHAEARVGKRAPAFKVVDERGKTHTLEAYRGKLLVLEWTNPGCPFVKRHYLKKQTMVHTARAFVTKVTKGKVPVRWLAVNSSYFNKAKDSRAWAKARKLPYPTLQDPEGKLGKAYGAKSTPHIFIIGPKGVVRYAGAIDDDPHGEKASPRNHVRRALEALTKGKAPKPASTTPYGCSVKYAK